MKVFYCWQSDSPEKNNRYFIKECLEQAIQSLVKRGYGPIELDHDTRNVLGSPVIVDTILEKIAESDVVVTDMTLVGEVPAIGDSPAKQLINSNVAMEVGFALGRLESSSLLQVMNVAYGSPENLPFDFRGRRNPVTYRLGKQLEQGERATVLTKVKAELESILQLYCEKSVAYAGAFEPAKNTFSPAAYWELGESLYFTDGTGFAFQRDVPLAYFRIHPMEAIPEVPPNVLRDWKDVQVNPPTIGGGSNWGENDHGVIRVLADFESPQLLASTQIFDSGEIWGISSEITRLKGGTRYFYPLLYESAFAIAVLASVESAFKHLGYNNSYVLELGTHGFSGAFFAGLESFTLSRPKFLTDPKCRVYELRGDDQLDLQKAIHGYFNDVFRAARENRPKILNNTLQMNGVLGDVIGLENKSMSE